jgi:hypothetical protein
MSASQHPQLVNRLPTITISIPLVVLFIATAFLLFLSSDDNVATLWLQCSPTAEAGLLPRVSQIPLMGQPSCFLISFFDNALASSRAFAVMSVILSFVGVLLTISTIESARIFNSPNFLIRNPTLPWLFFNLAGGAVAWQAIIVPAFIHRSRQAHAAQSLTSAQSPRQRSSVPIGESASLLTSSGLRDPTGSEQRHLSSTEIYAIPISVAIGFVFPSAIMLFAPSTLSISIWLVFPLWVSLVRQACCKTLILSPIFPQFTSDKTNTKYLESEWRSIIVVYALPALLSLVSQAILFRNLLQSDDGSPTSRAALGFIEIDFSAIDLTVFYWLLLEAGWKILGMSLACSLVAGPGAGLVLGWIMREEVMKEVDLTRRYEE